MDNSEKTAHHCGYVKYSNERSRKFCIRTQIETAENGCRRVRKFAAYPQAEGHVKGLYEKYCGLERDLSGTKLRVNPCTIEGETAVFPFLAGRTLEEELDELLKKSSLRRFLEKSRAILHSFQSRRRHSR